MKRHLQVPNRPEYVEVLAMTTAPCDVVSFLLEVGAIAAQDVARTAHIRQGIEQAVRRMVGVPNEERDERYLDGYDVLGTIASALAAQDYQGYLAFRLRDDRSVETLIDALSTVYGSHGYRYRPWGRDADHRASRVLQEALPDLFPSLHRTRSLNTPPEPLPTETAGGA